MELGPIQKKWIETLKAHPERQLKGSLGKKDESGNMQMCCLGQYLVCYHESIGDADTLWNNQGSLLDTDGSINTLWKSSKTLMLRDNIGSLATHYSDCTSLAEMNDEGMTWPQIAEYIEQHPEDVFTGSI